MDRQVIRIDVAPTQAGIAAALRQAFRSTPLRTRDEDHRFDELLARIH